MITKENLMQIAGPSQVSQEAAVLGAYARDVSFVNAVKPGYVVKPQTGQEIQSLVKLANETGTPLVPVSSGPPHFRGDTVPGTVSPRKWGGPELTGTRGVAVSFASLTRFWTSWLVRGLTT